MATHSAWGVLVSVWVPSLRDNRLDWGPCPDLPRPLGTEPIATCEDTPAVLRAQGTLASRLLKRGYHGFRLLARDRDSDELTGSSEWYASPETGVYLPYPGGLWSACDYGMHHHGWGDAPALAVA